MKVCEKDFGDVKRGGCGGGVREVLVENGICDARVVEKGVASEPALVGVLGRTEGRETGVRRSEVEPVGVWERVGGVVILVTGVRSELVV